MPLHPLAGDIALVFAALLAVIYKFKNRNRVEPQFVALTSDNAVLENADSRSAIESNFKWKWLFLIFMIWSLLSTTNSPQPFLSQFSWLYNVGMCGVIYYLTAGFLTNPHEQRRFIRFLLVGAILVCIYGILQYVQMKGLAFHVWVDSEQFPGLKRRMYSTLFNPNILGEYLLMILGVAGTAFLLDLRIKCWKRLIILFPICVLFFLCMVLTYSRGVWVSFAFIVLYWGLTVDKRLLVSLLAIPLVLFFYQGEVASRLWSLFSGQDTSTLLRIALWDSTTYMIADYPILGIGWDAFKWVYPEYNYFIQEENILIYHAHNMYLNVLAETGIIGAVTYFGAIYSEAFVTWKFAHRHPKHVRVAFYAIGAFIVGISISGLTDHDLFAHQTSVIFWQLMGWGIACLSTKQN